MFQELNYLPKVLRWISDLGPEWRTWVSQSSIFSALPPLSNQRTVGSSLHFTWMVSLASRSHLWVGNKKRLKVGSEICCVFICPVRTSSCSDWPGLNPGSSICWLYGFGKLTYCRQVILFISIKQKEILSFPDKMEELNKKASESS